MNQNDKANLETLVHNCRYVYKKSLESIISEDGYKSTICIYDSCGDICGFASIDDNDRCLSLDVLFVSVNSRGFGYGSALIEQVRRYAKSEGYEGVELMVNLDNIDAQRLYLKRRFLFTKLSKDDNVATMKKFVSNNVYLRGAMLFEIAKKYGCKNVLDGLQDVLQKKEYSAFCKYLKNKNDVEIVEKILSSDIMKETATFVSESLKFDRTEKDIKIVLNRMKNRSMYLENEQKFKELYPETVAIPQKDLRKVGLSVDAYMSFIKNEALLNNCLDQKEKLVANERSLSSSSSLIRNKELEM